MKKSRLIEILRICSKKELRELKKWVQSPAHNQRTDVIRLYDYLLEEEHFKKDEFIAKSVAFRWVYPKEEFDDAKMRQAIYFLMKTLEEFLIYQEISQDEVEAKMVLSKVYRKKRLNKLFEKNIRNIKELQEKQPFRNVQFFRHQYLRLKEEYVFKSNLTRSGPMNLQEVSNAHDINYIVDKLSHACYMLSHQKVYKTDYDFGLVHEVLDFIESHPQLLDIPAIAVYFFGYKTTTDKDNESNFLSLKTEILSQGHFFPKLELLTLYIMALNYCIGRINAGFISYYRQSFDLYKGGIETGTLIEEGIISRFTFSNIVTNSTYLKEFQWTENFIQNFQKYLEKKHREDVVQFCLARLHYEKQEFEAAMHICSQADYDDILMNLYSRAMVMKIYYHQKEFDVLESYLESFRNYVVRKKVLGYHKANYKNIIRLTKKLVKTNPYSKKEKEKLKAAIESVTPLTEKTWLLAQLEEMK